ncbi:hypothetical protein JMJ35_007331 [Cladonia borealis]|uniref:Uncharacterized protein n=1 Tax=Cladonia borealis TaxID=184061 RepID=A0AA39UZN9_9LECA|nr:hypothetical protein JMJ35_007331 [Cladonia borealis]
MVAIARHPMYRTHVRRLCISPKAIPSPLLDRQQFEDWLHGDRNLIGDPRLSYANGGHYPNVRPNVIWEQMPPHLDDAYQEYKQTYLDQVEFQPKAEALLQYSISQFALLTYVISRVHWPRQKWLHAGSWRDCCQDQGVHPLTHAWQAGVVLPVFDMEQAESVLKAVIRGQSYSGAQIDISSLLQDCDTRIMDLRIANSGEYLLQDLTANIRQLNVFFNSFSLEGLTNLMITGKFANFLARLAKLSNLTCSMRRLNGSTQRPTVHTPQTFGLTDIFANTVWPHLTNLNLERFLTSEAEPMNVLARHKFSLRSLSLQYLLLSRGSWYAIFADLRGGALQQLEVWHLGYRNDASRVYDELFLSDPNYWAPGPLSESHPLYQFVVHNETWDDSIADDLAANRRCWGFRERLITGS